MKSLKIMAAAAGLALGVGSAEASCSVPGNANEFATQIAQGLNATRRANGLNTLQFDRRLSRAAMRHACDMQQNAFFDHRGSDGSGAHQRVKAVGYRTCMTAENLAYGYPQAQTVVNGWMQSPGHRTNMLVPQAREFGVAIVDGTNSGPIAVLVVAMPCGA